MKFDIKILSHEMKILIENNVLELSVCGGIVEYFFFSRFFILHLNIIMPKFSVIIKLSANTFFYIENLIISIIFCVRIYVLSAT